MASGPFDGEQHGLEAGNNNVEEISNLLFVSVSGSRNMNVDIADNEGRNVFIKDVALDSGNRTTSAVWWKVDAKVA